MGKRRSRVLPLDPSSITTIRTITDRLVTGAMRGANP